MISSPATSAVLSYAIPNAPLPPTFQISVRDDVASTTVISDLTIDHLRLKVFPIPEVTSTPQLIGDLGDDWQDFIRTETVQSIDTVWERVTWDDTTTFP